MARGLTFATAVAVGCALAVHARTAGLQEKPPAQQPAATFRSGVDLVAVDVSVVDPRGRPVSDLTPDAFVLTVDGKSRKLTSAQFISQTRTVQAPERTDVYSSNAGAGTGRLIMLVIDQSNIRAGASRAYVEAAEQFIDRLSPADRLGLTVIPGAGNNVDFTANHALVKTLLSRVTGMADQPVGTHHVGVAEAMEVTLRNNRIAMDQLLDRECPPSQTADERRRCEEELRGEARSVLSNLRARTGDLLIALRTLLSRLSSTSEPKTLVLVSERLVLEDRRSQLSWVGPLAAAARASLYVLRLDAVTFDASEQRLAFTANEDRQLGIDGLGELAGMARGAIFPVASSPERVFDRLALELSGYYLLSFEPGGSDRDGKAHDIDVRVRRQGVEVRARRTFSVDTTRATMSEEDLLAETLRSPLLAAEIPVKVTTYTFRDVSSSKLRIMISAEIGRSASRPDPLALGYALVDNNGRLAGSELQKDLQPPTPDATVQPFSTAVLVSPGIYTLKLAVLDSEGNRGSVEHSFRAELQSAGQLKLGELMLATVRRGAVREVRPLVDTEVSSDSLYAYVEMYSDVAALLESASATLDVAPEPNARALESGPIVLQDVEAGHRRTGEGNVPVALLPAGSYVARAVVSVSGRPVARLTRPFRITRSLTPSGTEAAAPPPVPEGTISSVALAMGVGAFQRDSVLRPTVVGFFLDRLFTRDTAAMAAPLRPATDAARSGRFDALAAEIDKLDPKVAAQLVPTFLRGLSLFSRGELEAAATAFREAIRIDSGFFPAAFYLGACYAAGGRDREAVGAWQTALVTESDAPFIYILLGDGLLRLGEASQAIEILREAAALWPDNDDLRMRIGMAFAMAGFGPEALSALDPYLERHPGDHERLFLAMRLLYEAAAAGRSIVSPQEDRARFARYAKAYAEAQGPQIMLVEQWQKFIDSKGVVRE